MNQGDRHHVFPVDLATHRDPASASVQHKWWELDVTYYIILLLERVGLATDVIRPRHVRQAR